MVRDAFQKVKKNQGSAGVDKVSIADFEQKLDKHLYKIWNRLTSGSYMPPPVREAEMPKKDGTMRKLGIPTVADRVAQQVVKSYLEPRLELVFHTSSYGYRPKRSAHQAIEAVRKNVRGHSWVLDMDIKSFFDEVDHGLLMKAVTKHVEEPWARMYVKRWLEMPIEDKKGRLHQKQGKGTPQGGVISPLLANLFLHYVLDKWLDKHYPQIAFVRYADDVIMHCRTEGEANALYEAAKARMQACKLRVHEGKTKIVYCQDYRREKKARPQKFDFLGFSFQPRPMRSKRPGGGWFLGYDCAISISSKKKIVATLRAFKFHKWSTATIEELAKVLNPKIGGWVNYFDKFGKNELSRVFRVFHNRLVRWVLNRYKSLKGSIKRAYRYLRQLRDAKPLFYHWKKGYNL
jgi:group II intron reverse transcriptase/maturase